MDEPMPRPEGISPGPRIVPERIPPPTELQLSQNETWYHVAQEHTFFTPALLMLCTPNLDGRDAHPLLAVATQLGRFPHIQYVETEFPLFLGLRSAEGDESYMHTLFLMDKQDWAESQQILGTLAWNDSQKNILRRLRFQEVLVQNRAAPQALVVPKTPVVAWAVETNRGSFYFKDPDPRDFLARPVATFDASATFPDTVHFAEALRQGRPDPYSA